MLKTFLLSIMMLSSVGCFAVEADKAWDSVYVRIQERIKAPTFANRKYSVKKYGASPRATAARNQQAIQKAIDKCSAKGGGSVIVPAGIYRTGALTLKDNVNLVIEKKATLLFVYDTKLYPIVKTRWEGVDCWNYQPMIYACNAKNIGITGDGTIDGGAGNGNWWAWVGHSRFGWQEGMPTAGKGRHELMAMNRNEVPVDQRRCESMGLRPQLINIMESENILIEGVTLLRSPFWVIHPAMSKNITVRNVRVWNEGPNGDGCDPESCEDVLIEGCNFHTGDDCIAIKSGRNADGRRWNRPSKNIIVRNCIMEDGHGGVVIGSEITGGANNVFVENCQMSSPNLDRVIRIKTNSCRGGDIHDVFVRRVRVGECGESVLKINLDYDRKENDRRGFIPAVHNIWLDDVTCQKSQYGVLVVGLEDQNCVSDIHVNKCSFTGISKQKVKVLGQARDMELDF